MRTPRDRHPAVLLFGAVALLVPVACSGGGDGAEPVATPAEEGPAGDGSSPTTVSEPDTTSVEDTTTTGPVDAPDPAVAEVASNEEAPIDVWDEGGYVFVDRFGLLLADGYGPQRAAEIADDVGGTVVGEIGVVNLFQIAVDAPTTADVVAVVERVGAMEGVDVAFPEATWAPDEEVWGEPISPIDGDPVYDGPAGEGYRLIGVEQAWRFLRASGLKLNKVKVGVLDTAYWERGGDQSEMDGATIEYTNGGKSEDPEEISYVDRRTGETVVVGPDPSGSHGTGVANIIGADPDDGGVAGIAGVLGDDLTIAHDNIYAPNRGGIKVYSEDPDPEDEALVVVSNGQTASAAAMRSIVAQVSADPPAKVINISSGCTGCNTLEAEAWTTFLEQMERDHPGTLFVCSAGNNNQSVDGARRYPSGSSNGNVVTVGNVMNNGDKAPSSNTRSGNYEVTLAAPGDEAVQNISPDGKVVDNKYEYGKGYRSSGGTSMAAPQVAATAALLAAIKPDITAAEMKDILTRSARTTISVDGKDKSIPGGVGGRVLATDLAVFELIKQERARLGMEPAALTPEYLAQLGLVPAVARSTEDVMAWDVAAFIDACEPSCTNVTISVSGDGYSIGGDTSQALGAPGEVGWSVTFSEYPAVVTVRRDDNGAGSRITLDPIVIDGAWQGGATIEAVDVPPEMEAEASEQGCDLVEVVGMRFGLYFDIVTDGQGSGNVGWTISPPAGTEGEPATGTSALTWDGTNFAMVVEDDGVAFSFTGQAVRGEGGVVTLRGTWVAADPSQPGVSFSGSWDVARAE